MSINWSIFLKHPNVSHKFQFTAQHQTRELEFLPWLALVANKPFAELSNDAKTELLLSFRKSPGFSQRLNQHLAKDPNFLLDLILDSKENFAKIVNTKIIFHLDDIQLAKAIVHHAEQMVKPHINPLIEVEHFIHDLNGILSHGRSVSVMLRNSEARKILDGCKYFQIYQSDEYEHRYAPHPRPM